jgi:hypothetical protein
VGSSTLAYSQNCVIPLLLAVSFWSIPTLASCRDASLADGACGCASSAFFSKLNGGVVSRANGFQPNEFVQCGKWE